MIQDDLPAVDSGVPASAPVAGYRLSPRQQRIWTLGEAATACCDLRLCGDLDRSGLATALERIVRRHEILRTTFRHASGFKLPVQVVGAQAGFGWRYEDLAPGTAADREEALATLLAAEASSSLDLQAGPPLRVLLVRLAAGEHLLRLRLPALCADRRSLENLAGELAAGYEGMEPTPADDDLVQYLQFSEWHHEELAGPAAAAGLRFWRERALAGGAPLPWLLPAAAGSPPAGSASTLVVALPAEATAVLKRAEGREADLLLAGWQALLCRLAGGEEAVVGALCEGRRFEELAGSIGPFAVAVPLACRVDRDASLFDLADRVAAARAEVGERLDFYEPDGQLPEIGFGFAAWPESRTAGGVTFEVTGLRVPSERFALELEGRRRCGGWELALHYDPARYAPAAAERLLGGLVAVLRSAADDPGGRIADLEILDEPERRRLLVEVNATRRDFGSELATHQLVEEQARKTPAALALTCGHRSLTYAALDVAAEALAHRLRQLGVGPEARVGIWAARSPEAVVALLAVWKAGGAFVPLDPSYPAERLAFMLRDAGATALLAAPAERLPDFAGPVLEVDLDPERPPEPLPAGRGSVDPGNLAYVLYTSGSTGLPKGVAVPHRGLVNYLLWAVDRYQAAAGFGAPVHSSLAFDLTLTGLLAPLLVGGAVELLPEDIGALPAALRSRGGASLVKLTPSHLEVLQEALAGVELAGRTHALVIGGEELRGGALAPWRKHAPETRLFNEYGPTETVVGCCVYEVPPGEPAAGRVPIGRPIGNTRIFLLDSALRPVPTGVPGQIFVGGAGVARGYIGHPDLTAERFVPDPLGGEPGERLYATGDLGCWLEDGELDFRGRLDGQVKLRGVRIEPGEIEAVLSGHPAVREAAVVLRRDLPGGPALTAYVVLRPGAAATSAEMLAAVRGRLPAAMVPAAVVILPVLPLTPNGKVDRTALPAPAAGGAAPGERRPRTPTEQMVAEIWTGVLGIASVDADDNFVAQGGHSLTAMQILARVLRWCGVEIPVDRFFAEPTFGALVARIDVALLAGEVPPVPPIEPAPRGRDLPLSSAQERLWFLAQLEPDDAAYHILAALRLSGDLSVPSLAWSLGEVLRRHEVLRTAYGDVDGRAVQRVSPWSPLRLPVVDLAALPVPRRDAEQERVSRDEVRRRFDLARGPVLRALLFRLAPGEHAVLCTMHHIASDGWSVGVLTREVAELYDAAVTRRPPLLAPLPIQYADFASWQRRWLAGEVLEAHLDFWRRSLAGAPERLELPADRPRAAVRSSRGAVEPLALPEPLAQGIRSLSREVGATPFMTLLAAFQVLLCRHAGQPEVVVGVPTAGRRRVETESLIGLFVNTLALRLALGDTADFPALVEHVRGVVLAAHAHEDLPFEKLVEELHPQRDLARTPLFQAMFAFDNTPRRPFELTGLRLAALPLASGAAKFDLSLLLGEAGTAFGGIFEYAADLFDAPTVARMAAHLKSLLAAVVADPARPVSDLPLLSAPERHQLLIEARDTSRPRDPEAPLHLLIAGQAACTPDAIAVTWAAGALSYGELDRRADRLMRHLASLGVRPEVCVAVAAARSPELLLGILATLKAGGAYVPLDPSHPTDRLGFQVADSGAVVLLADASVPPLAGARLVRLDEDLPETAEGSPPADISLDHLAYVMYTSGSTGRPKGTLITHRSLIGYLDWAVEAYAVTDGPGAPLFSSAAFDLSVTSLFAPLLAGRSVYLAAAGEGLDPLLDVLAAGAGTGLLKLTPAHLRALAALPEGDRLAARTLVVGGEALFVEDLAPWWEKAPGMRIFNEYGPTEATVACCLEDAGCGRPAAGAVPIGRPIAGAWLHVVNRALRPVPLGVVGELLIGGPGLARGYLGRPDLTAERFVPDPFAAQKGLRLYRSGDLARQLADGRLEYRGRADDQVKVRGFRVELEEVEAVLAGHPGVRQAAVAPHDGGGGLRLVAYVVAAGPGAARVDELRAFLAARLPVPMVPAVFVELPGLPLAASGKVDRRALPAPSGERPDPGDGFAAPRSRVERLLAAIWQEVLQLDRVGVDENFFEIGGDSILSIQIVARAARAGVRITPRQVFQHQTIAALAAAADAAPAVTAEQGPVIGEAPLTPIQHWFFEQELPAAHHYNQALLLEVVQDLDPGLTAAALERLVAHHDALRLRFERLPDGWRQRHAPPADERPFAVVDLAALPPEARRQALTRACSSLQESFDLAAGPLFRAAWLERGPEASPLLLLLAHHLVMDGVSWRILLEDLADASRQLARGEAIELPPKTTSFRAWAERLSEHARSAAVEPEAALWRSLLAEAQAPLPRDLATGADTLATTGSVEAVLEPAETKALLQEVPRAYGTRIDEVLLAALGLALARWTGSSRLQVDLESHGREELWPDVDLSRTVGWLTAIHPVTLDVGEAADPGAALRAVKEQMRRIPDGGLGYGLLRYLRPGAAAGPPSEVVFNYLGRLDPALPPSSPFRPAAEWSGPSRDGRQPRPYALEINSGVLDGRLRMSWQYGERRYRRETVEGLAAGFLAALQEVIRHCLDPTAGRPVPSDFRRVSLSEADLDAIASELDLD